MLLPVTPQDLINTEINQKLIALGHLWTEVGYKLSECVDLEVEIRKLQEKRDELHAI